MSEVQTAVVTEHSAVPKPVVAPWLAVAVPAVAMSLGWGLRGQFGGPRGAMAPGALVALALVVVGRERIGARRAWLVAAAGALGFAVGGEETYMQTVTMTRHASTAVWGFLGLLIKGAEWGGLGGLFLGAALGRRRYTAGQILLAANVALALGLAGYALVDAPKLVYFSGGPGMKPRPEAWAGIMLTWLALLVLAARAGDRMAVRMSLFGAGGCAAGFMLGVAAFGLGDTHLGAATAGFWDWWKVAECGFGLAGGAALGWGWLTARQPAGPDPLEEPPGAPAPPMTPWLLAIVSLDLLLFFYVADAVDGIGGWVGKAPFAFIAPALALLALRWGPAALSLGVVMPVAVVFYNVQQYWAVEHRLVGVAPSVAGMALLTAALAWAAWRWRDSPRALFLLVAWTTVGCAWLKMGIPAPGVWATYIVVQGIFTAMAVWLTLTAMQSAKCKMKNAK